MLTAVQQSTAQLQMYINITSHVAPSHFVESFEILMESHHEKKIKNLICHTSALSDIRQRRRKKLCANVF